VTGRFVDAEPMTLKRVLTVCAFAYGLSQIAYKRIFKSEDGTE